MERSQRLTDSKRWRTFIRLLRLDFLMTSYTSARHGAGLLSVDLDLARSIPAAGGPTPARRWRFYAVEKIGKKNKMRSRHLRF
jgi:hypothetical protein